MEKDKLERKSVFSERVRKRESNSHYPKKIQLFKQQHLVRAKQPTIIMFFQLSLIHI